MAEKTHKINTWTERKERGSSRSIRFMHWLCRHRFQRIVHLLLYPIVAYFFLTSGDTKKASRHFFLRATGSFSWLDHYKQLMCFSRSLVDRISILMGESKHITVHAHGREQLIDAQNRGQGAILLGAHLGSFEACKGLVKEQSNIDVHIVAYHGSSQKIRSVLDEINPEMAKRVIDPSDPEAVFKMREVVESGGFLAILADRVGLGDKTVKVNFLGGDIQLPAGPYLLASILRCPVYCFFGMRIDHNVYESHTVKLADQVTIPRNQRSEYLTKYAQQYANILAEHAQNHPHNWFNFFEFWNITEESNHS